MDKNLVAKTLLVGFSSFRDIEEAYNVEVLRKAENSRTRETSVAFDDIAEVIARRVQLQTLREKTEELLKKTPIWYRKILVLNYIQGLTSCRIAEMYKKTTRTVFRYIKQATQYFADRLETVGIDDEAFEHLLKEHAIVRNIHARVKQESKSAK